MPFLFHSRRSTACGKADIRSPLSLHAHERSILFFTKLKKATNSVINNKTTQKHQIFVRGANNL